MTDRITAVPYDGDPMTAIARPRAATITVPGRSRPGREIFRTAGSVAPSEAIFGFALPHFASYRSVWASMYAMTWAQALLVAAAAAASMVSAWIMMICSVLRSIRLREAAWSTPAPTPWRTPCPPEGALAMGVSWATLSSWRVSTAEYALYALVSGIWNIFARLGLPVAALMILATAGLSGPAVVATAVGLALLTAMATGLGLLMRSESFPFRRAARASSRSSWPAGWYAWRRPSTSRG